MCMYTIYASYIRFSHFTSVTNGHYLESRDAIGITDTLFYGIQCKGSPEINVGTFLHFIHLCLRRTEFKTFPLSH
jgi:hypothetical protein